MDSKELKAIYQNYAKAFSFEKKPTNLYVPVDYIMNLGGKNIRATLLLMSNNMYDDNVDKALPLAHAIELFHNFTLVHDDIMDEALLRRGHTTVHHKYGINSGILSGDVMLIYVYKILNGIDDKEKCKTILDVFTQTAIEVCEGQQYDVDFEQQDTVTIEDYLLMIKLKTAVLIAAALHIGAIMGGASEEDARGLYEFGINAGIAFQIQDDLLDAYGDQELIGKKRGGDIVQNKKTILYLTAIANSSATDEQKLRTLYANNILPEKEKIEVVTSLFDKYEVKETVILERDAFIGKAFDCLKNLNGKETSKVQLREMAEFLIKRKK